MDTQNLEKPRHRHHWYVVVYVPHDVRPTLGRKLQRSTGTDSLREAQRRRALILPEFRQRIEAERAKYSQSASQRWEYYKTEAKEIRKRAARGDYPDEDPDGHLLTTDIIEAEGIEKQFGVEGAQTFQRIAFGKHTPVSDVIETWLSDIAATKQTGKEYRGIVNEFLEWNNDRVGVEEVTKRTVADYVTGHLKPQGLSAPTINKKVYTLSNKWDWLVRRGYAKENVWSRQGVPKSKDHRGGTEKENKRAFTDDEVRALLSNMPDRTMADFVTTLLLTGMRRDDLAEVTVDEVSGGWFHLTQGKTQSAVRRVPIHPDIQPIVDRRCADKASHEYLFHEIGAANHSRADALGKKFGRYRKKIGVDEPNGSRGSRVDMHSTRRWFITKAEQAGHDPWTIGFVVGHQSSRNNMTLHYSAGPSDDQLRAVVESVKLP